MFVSVVVDVDVDVDVTKGDRTHFVVVVEAEAVVGELL